MWCSSTAAVRRRGRPLTQLAGRYRAAKENGPTCGSWRGRKSRLEPAGEAHLPGRSRRSQAVELLAEAAEVAQLALHALQERDVAAEGAELADDLVRVGFGREPLDKGPAASRRSGGPPETTVATPSVTRCWQQIAGVGERTGGGVRLNSTTAMVADGRQTSRHPGPAAVAPGPGAGGRRSFV